MVFMNYYSIPSDFKIETIEKYAALNQEYHDRIAETYGQLNCKENIFGSGRASNDLPHVDCDQLKEYISYSKLHEIGFNYTLNTTCLSNREFTKDGQKKIINFLIKLVNLGVTAVTICLPSLIELVIRSHLPLHIKGSTVCGIINTEKAREFSRMGVERIVVDESINRDFDQLHRISQVFPNETELIVNVICDMNCVYRPFHHNQMSHDYHFEAKSVKYYSHRCSMRRAQKPENILKMNFIRPEDIPFYESVGINRYKIQGRQATLKGNIPKTVEAYLRKSYDGDLLNLLDCFFPTNSFRTEIYNRQLNDFLKPFLKPGFCVRDCENCNYCREYCIKNLPSQELENVNKRAIDFYNSMDEYNRDLEEWNKR